MRVTSLKVTNFRSIVQMPPIDLDRINLLIGPNNAGKSSLIRALYSTQQGAGTLRPDVRVGADEAQIQIEFEELDVGGLVDVGDIESGKLTTTIKPDGSEERFLRGKRRIGEVRTFALEPFSNREPAHWIVPYLAKRKAMSYNEDVRLEHALSVAPQLNYLAAKLSRLGNSSFPGHDRYVETCRKVLGFVVSAVPSDNGQRPGVFVDGTETIPIDQMGEGVPNIVALLAELALAKGKLFLLEEPENDLHPRALKALLDLVVESANDNQFVVSTHSNVVVRHLGATEGSRLYSVDAERGTLPPVAKVTAVPPTAEARLALLRDLGYSFSDFDLWEGWLILEESSAERIIRDHLIPYFTPTLTRVRTVSTGGNSEVETTFEDFNRLVRFTHLEDAYRGRAWVIVDGDEEGQRIVERLRDRYKSWQPERFAYLRQGQFERYYPTEFADRVDKVLAIMDKKARRDEKRALLGEVLVWLDEDFERAKTALEESASEVIFQLRAIEEELSPGSRALAPE